MHAQQTIRQIAPEDIAVGDVVVVTHAIGQFVPPCDRWSSQGVLDPIRVRVIPWDAGSPHEVIDVCLPFILAADADGDISHLDTRKHTIARVPATFMASARAHKARARTDYND